MSGDAIVWFGVIWLTILFHGYVAQTLLYEIRRKVDSLGRKVQPLLDRMKDEG